MTPIDLILWALAAGVAIVVVGMAVALVVAAIRGAQTPQPKKGEEVKTDA